MLRLTTALVLLGLATACASAPVAPPPAAPPAPVVPPLDQRLGQVLRLEDQRWLDDGAGANLALLVGDADARVRRRAATAIGRIGMVEGVPLLVSALGDADAGVRANAAFGLGVLKPSGARGAAALEAGAIAALVTALGDPDLTVRARAIDGLALLAEPVAGATPPAAGTPSPATVAASAIAGASATCGAVLAAMAAPARDEDVEREPLAPELEVCRASLLALTRLRQYDALKTVALDASGVPVSRWWPVAYALQRTGDRRAADALSALVTSDGVMTSSLALTGLAAFGDRRALPVARAAVERRSADLRLRIAAARALGRLKDTAAVAILQRVIDDSASPVNLVLEAVAALGAIGDVAAFDGLGDLFTAKSAPLRAAAMTAAARLDPDRFLLLVSGIPPEKDWWVKGQLAGVFASLDGDRVRGTLVEWASDTDPRLQAAALTALAKVGAADLDARLASALEAPDFALRATAAGLMADRDTAGAVERLAAAYRRGLTDAVDGARASAIAALASQARRRPASKDAVVAALRPALTDPSWPLRLQAADALRALGDASAAPARPAPTRFPREFYESPAILRPPYSPHAFLETRLGTIEIELNVVESPLTSQSFVTLARKGYFSGMRIHRVVPNFVLQTGDDRGDGEGGPGYAIRDELSPLPYLRGTVGMALSGPDTGGSQFFIAITPQPHLTGKYAVFGQVVRGMEIVERLSQWDVIDRIRVWDGVSF